MKAIIAILVCGFLIGCTGNKPITQYSSPIVVGEQEIQTPLACYNLKERGGNC